MGAITSKKFHASDVLCRLLMTSSRTSLIMAEFFSKWQIYCDFSLFKSIIWPCGRVDFKSFSCILLKFVILEKVVNYEQFSDKFNNGWKKKLKTAYLFRFMAFYLNNFLRCGRDKFKSFLCILLKFVPHFANNQFSDKFNNSGGLLSSPFLFIITVN